VAYPVQASAWRRLAAFGLVSERAETIPRLNIIPTDPTLSPAAAMAVVVAAQQAVAAAAAAAAQAAAQTAAVDSLSPSAAVRAALAASDPAYKIVNEKDDNNNPTYFTLAGDSIIGYGRGSRFTFKALSAGRYECGNSTFGDPAPGERKACYHTGWRPTTAAPSPAEAQIAYVIRRWATHRLWEIPEADRQRLAAISDLSHESGAQFPRGSPISPVFLRVVENAYPIGGSGQLDSLIRRDAGERARDAAIDHAYFFSPAVQDWYVWPVRTIYQQDWGTFGIEGFHIEDNIAKITAIVGGVVGMVLPGVGTVIGVALAAGGKAAQGMVGTHADAQTGKAAQGVIVGTAEDLMRLNAVDLLYTPAGEPIDPNTGEVIHPSQIDTPQSGEADSKILLYGGLGLLALLIIKS
jgi:hypothetical protein